jgi:predicted DNA-binding transcriptional regulator AlpA
MSILLDAGWATKCEVAEFLRLSTRSVDRLVQQGRLPAPSYFGTRPRWNSQSIREWAAAGRCGAPRVKPCGIPDWKMNSTLIEDVSAVGRTSLESKQTTKGVAYVPTKSL